MDKREIFFILLVFIFTGFAASAQSSSSAYQRIELHIMPSIEIASLKASEVQLTVKDKTGKASSAQEFRIRSNKNFVLKASRYETAEQPAGNGDLKVAVNGEGTYTAVSSSPKDIISKGRRGEQVFAVNYEVKHAKHNNQSMGVMYTATEP